MAWLQDELGNWYNDEPDYSYFDNIDVGGGWSPSDTIYTYWTPETEGDQEFMKFMEEAYKADQSTGVGDIVKTAFSALGSGAKDFLKKYLFDPSSGKVNLAGLGTAAAGLYSLMNQKESGGYNKPVPKMEAVRQQVQYEDEGRRPGATGRRYFTDTQFIPQGDAAAREAAVAAAASQAQGLRALQPAAAPAANPWAGKMNLAALKGETLRSPIAAQAAPARATLPELMSVFKGIAQERAPGQSVSAQDIPMEAQQPTGFTNMAHGGIAELAKGGRYLGGPTDGMADEINTTIDEKQPAKLSHGEFVIPADVVSHLGNGNSDAGAKKLYQMMAKVRKARTGNEKQGKQINPDKFMPGGLAAAYAAGGSVKTFQTGGTANTTSGAAGVPLDTSRTSTLSPWVGDYVTNALGQGAAMAAQPFQAYTGPLTAGPSNLQQQAFAGASEIAQTGYTPTQFNTGTFNTQAVQQYMNPYLEVALQPQLAELNRQAQIRRMEDASRLTKAGAFGGGRQAVMEAEGGRNLMDAQSKLLGQGYATAYDKAMGQFNAQQQREMEAQRATEASRQYGSEFGLKSLDYLTNLGKTQRDIEAEGLAADRAQFEEERDYAYKMPQYQLNLLQGLPIGAQTSSTDTSGMAGLQSSIAGLASLYKTLSALGQTPTTPAKT